MHTNHINHQKLFRDLKRIPVLQSREIIDCMLLIRSMGYHPKSCMPNPSQRLALGLSQDLQAEVLKYKK